MRAGGKAKQAVFFMLAIKDEIKKVSDKKRTPKINSLQEDILFSRFFVSLSLAPPALPPPPPTAEIERSHLIDKTDSRKPDE